MRGLAQWVLSHCPHIPDCNQHVVHGIHIPQGRELMQMIAGAPQLSIFLDPPGWSEVDLRLCGP